MNVAVIFGGKSAEYEVSLVSATYIVNSMDKSAYRPVLLLVDKQGEWFYNKHYRNVEVDLKTNNYSAGADKVYLSQAGPMVEVISKTTNDILASFEVAFPIIHGTYGEDGTLQGLLKAENIPYVGPDVLGSAIAMDKDIAKRLFAAAGIPVAKWLTAYREGMGEEPAPAYGEAVAELGTPFFVKPANAGSSVGVSRVSSEADYEAALANAFKYDHKVLLEEGVVGKELECAVLGNIGDMQASSVGEIVATKDFYSYEAKYVSSTGADLRIPADIDAELLERIRRYALLACKAIHCEGMARVDFLLSADGRLVLNEVNTLPGFTSISMYPKLWAHSGIQKGELVSRLITLALQRHRRDAALSIRL